MKLLFVMNAPVVGGAERHTMALADRLAGERFEGSIFALNRGPLTAPSGVELDQPEPSRGRLARIGDLAKRISEGRPDLIVAVNERPAIVAMIARARARAAKPPIVLIWHSTVARNLKEAALGLLHTPVFNSLDAITFISENQRAYWRRHRISPKREAVIPNGVDVARFSPAARAKWRDETRQRLGIHRDTLVVGVNAVLRPEKNHLQLVEAVARLRQQGRDVLALLVGDGPMSSAIRARAPSLGVADRILMPGLQADVRPFVAAFDVGAICSTSIETLSLSALETMAMGIPVVMSDLGGATEIVDGENGRIVAVGDLSSLREALASFFDPIGRAAAGARARATVERRFPQELMVANYVAWFKKLSRLY
jgi:glycosyltransferase involved in cell wall biosynthesis